MLRLIRYAKPYTLIILGIILLLFIQANANLALPDYMSRIVNVGIQQGGIRENLPEALRRSTMEGVLLFLTVEEKELIRANYTLVDSSSPDYDKLLRKYPALAQEPIYVLKATDPAVKKLLRPPMAKALLVVSGIEMLREHPDQARKLMPSLGAFDLTKLPPTIDPLTFLARLPQEQRMRIREAVEQRFELMGGEQALFQAAARAVRAEYEALGMDVLSIQNAYILRVGGEMLIIAFIAAIATITVGLLAARVAAGLARDLRSAFFKKVMSFSGAELDRFSTASLITRSTNDITQIQNAMMFLLRMVFFAPLMGIGAIIHAVDKSPSMMWIIALGLVILIGVIALAFSITMPRFKMMQSLIDSLNRIARENLSGMMVIRAFNRQDYEQRRFDRANRQLTGVTLFVSRAAAVMMPTTMLLLNGIVILILWTGAHRVARMTIRIGDMIAFMQYAMQVFFAFMMLSMLLMLLPRVDVAANRIADVLETEISIRDPQDPVSFPEPFEPTIEFRNVSFRYPGAEEYVLHDISFVIRAGETVGIIGTTGSGKSTLVNLIPRFYDATEGAVLIGGVDIRRVRLRELRDHIGYVPQQSNLFTGTVESNLRFADEKAPEEALKRALEVAQADFILAHPEGLMAKVSEGGSNFSGGQRQRLTIARALVKRPSIYIFDDCFSSLDYRTDARLRRALKRYTRGSTVIIVSQRVATIKDADHILVLDEGRLIAQGSHKELMEKCQVYREIALSQLKPVLLKLEIPQEVTV